MFHKRDILLTKKGIILPLSSVFSIFFSYSIVLLGNCSIYLSNSISSHLVQFSLSLSNFTASLPLKEIFSDKLGLTKLHLD